MPLPTEKAQCSFADYLGWEENERAEIINGEVFLMASPSSVHQEIVAELIRQFACSSRTGNLRKTSIQWLNRIFPSYVTKAK